MQKTCSTCGLVFAIQETDRAFYKRVGAPEPSQCPDCRRQQRLMFRNFFNLYHRTCDLTGKKIISMYDKDVVFPVYEMHEWWGDVWDGLSYGMDVKLTGSLFSIMEELHRKVPRMSIVNSQSENTDYCNFSFASRNCYLIFGNVGNEDCTYGHIVWQSKDCYDCLYCYRCELCYECIDCVQCNRISYSRDCDSCSESFFLVHCNGCKSCFGCVDLKNKQYCIFNEQLSKDEYLRKLAEFQTGSHQLIETAKAKVTELMGKEIVKCYHGFGCENVVGDYLYNCNNVVNGYDLKNCEDCSHSATLESFTDSHDCNFSPAKSELCYNSLTVHGHTLFCCHSCLSNCSNLFYCDNCYSCKDCFGCVGLKQKQYCIFNKQYHEKEYRNHLTAIVDYMRKRGEWGQFFPYTFSPFAYNETIAAEYFPLTQEETLARGWRWKDMDPKERHYLGPTYEIPNSIQDAKDDIVQQILTCTATSKLYKIIPQELKFYRTMNISIPRKCPDQRHKERMVQRNPRKLFDRACAKCKKPIQTTYAPNRPETVYCEDCYLSTMN